MASELKACPNPWCSAINGRTHRQHCGGYWVRCSCGVCGPVASTKELAIAAWNKRTGEAVNSHETLVEALSGLLRAIEDWRTAKKMNALWMKPVTIKAHAALRSAGVEP